jgi:hypothetical protein
MLLVQDWRTAASVMGPFYSRRRGVGDRSAPRVAETGLVDDHESGERGGRMAAAALAMAMRDFDGSASIFEPDVAAHAAAGGRRLDVAGHCVRLPRGRACLKSMPAPRLIEKPSATLTKPSCFSRRTAAVSSKIMH